MAKPYLIITNNPKVSQNYRQRFQIQYLERGDYLSVLVKVRDVIHAGGRLLTHPMAGSLKPNQTPFRSVMLTEGKEGIDWADLEMIENSIAACHKFMDGRKTPIWTEKIRNDFATIDLSLMESAAANPMISRM